MISTYFKITLLELVMVLSKCYKIFLWEFINPFRVFLLLYETLRNEGALEAILGERIEADFFYNDEEQHVTLEY